jgi:putative SOS response-associated peptidase YedK
LDIALVCGRFSQAQIAELDREIFRLLSLPPLPVRYNVAPTQDAAAVRESAKTGRRILGGLRWGLIPSWAKDPAIGSRMINARAETVATKPSFEAAFRHRRCLIPADGFYEWKKAGSRKQPYYIGRGDGEVFAFAGLWERWSDEGHEPIETFAIITTRPNEILEPIHDRMPVILPVEHYDEWLDPDNRNTETLRALLEPFPAAEMSARPVTTYVNSPHNEGPECVHPLDP